MNKFRRVSAHAARLEKEHSTILERNGISDLKVVFLTQIQIIKLLPV